MINNLKNRKISYEGHIIIIIYYNETHINEEKGDQDEHEYVQH